MKRIISVSLVAVMLLLGAVSCSQNADNSGTSGNSETQTSAVGNESVQSSEEITEELKPNLPEGLDFEGHVFTILNNDYGVPGWAQRDIYAEELNGTPINDAVFQRNANISEKYNCEIQSLQTMDLNGTLSKAVNSQDDSIDLATPYFWNGQIGQNAVSGFFVNLKEVSSIDLSSPWYDQKSVQDLEIMDKLYFMTTDLTIGDEIATAGIVFNKKLYEDYGYHDEYGDIYQIVRDGKWTFDTFQNMVLSLSQDLDGNGKMDNNDFYGLLYQRDSLHSFINAFDMRFAEKDQYGVPAYTLITEANADKIDSIFNFLYKKDNCFHVMNYFDATTTDFTTGMCNMFINNQAMFMWIRFADVEMLRTMDVDFGIIPMPKYDENQKEYYSTVNNYMGTATVIPQSCYDPEKVGMFLEAISCESRKLLRPAYYDVNLQGKISRDEESRDMLDIIFENRAFDIGAIYNFGGFSEEVYRMTQTYNSDYASLYAKGQKKYDKSLEKFINDYLELE